VVLVQPTITSASPLSINGEGTFYINGNCLGKGSINNIDTNTNSINDLEKRIKILEDKVNNNNGNEKYKIVMGE